VESRLINDSSVDDLLAAQTQVLQWLDDFVDSMGHDVLSQLKALRQTEEQSGAIMAALTDCYINAPSMTYEQENSKWNAIYGYYCNFARAYQELLLVSIKLSAQSEPCAEQPTIVARTLYYLGRCAKWCFFRYQDVPHGDWIEMHRLYELAESGGYSEQTVQPWSTESESSCVAIYIRTLMLATLNSTSMTKKEINLADQWLEGWSRLIPLQQQFDRERQLFYVNLTEDIGGRRIRNLEPTTSCRYWNPDPIAKIIMQANSNLPKDSQLTGLEDGDEIEDVNYPLMYGYLLSEWSCDYYVRQRRKTERDQVRKIAYATHGIFNIYQHIKNITVYQDRSKNRRNQDRRSQDRSQDRRQDVTLAMNLYESADERLTWIINESPYGFGAIVNIELDTWLGVGKLVALDYENNKDLTIIGVLRSIKQLTDRNCLVGIDVLSHTPGYAFLLESNTTVPAGDLALEVSDQLALTFDGMSAFPGLYLPQDEERNIGTTLIIPRVNFINDGVYEIHYEKRTYLIRLGPALEKKDEWVRVEMRTISPN